MPCADCRDEDRCARFGVCQSLKFPLPGAYEARVKELAQELGMPRAMARADMESGPLTDIHGPIASEPKQCRPGSRCERRALGMEPCVAGECRTVDGDGVNGLDEGQQR